MQREKDGTYFTVDGLCPLVRREFDVEDDVQIALFVRIPVLRHPFALENNRVSGLYNFVRRACDVNASAIKVGDSDARETEQAFRQCNSDFGQKVVARTLKCIMRFEVELKYNIPGRNARLEQEKSEKRLVTHE